MIETICGFVGRGVAPVVADLELEGRFPAVIVAQMPGLACWRGPAGRETVVTRTTERL